MRQATAILAAILALSSANTTDAQEDVPSAPRSVDAGVIKTAPTEEILSAVDAGLYVPVPIDELENRLRAKEPEPVTNAPAIRRATWSATLTQTSLVNGSLTMQLEDTGSDGTVTLGQCNLLSLTFQHEGTDIPVAARPDGRLALLMSPTSSTDVTGTWSQHGTPGRFGVEFDLEVPPAAVTDLRITTAADVTLRSRNSKAIVKTESEGEETVWGIYLLEGTVASIVCSQKQPATTKAEQSISANTTLNVWKNSILARWDVLLPAETERQLLRFPVPSDCEVVTVSADSGAMSWSEEPETRSIVIRSDHQDTQTITIRAKRPLTLRTDTPLPLLSNVYRQNTTETESLQTVKLNRVRLIVDQSLAVEHLSTSGLYQRQVNFAAASGDQVIDLSAFTSDPGGTIRVSPVTVTAGVAFLVEQSADNPEEITVYAEVTPGSGRLFAVDWALSGDWRPTDVTELRTGQPSYFVTRPGLTPASQTLHIDLRSYATNNQPAQLRIRFRSTRAGTTDTGSVPALTNPRYTIRDAWILSSTVQLLPKEFRPVLVDDASDTIVAEFPWLRDEVTDRTGQQLVRVDTLQTNVAASRPVRTEISRTSIDYHIDVSGDRLKELIRLRLSAADALPQSTTLIFPEGIDVQLHNASQGVRLVRSGRRPSDRLREWTLMLPSDVRNSPVTLELIANRSWTGSNYAAIPQVPSSTERRIMALNVTPGRGELSRIGLVSDGSGESAETILLESGDNVRVSPNSGRLLLTAATATAGKNFLGARGTLYCTLDPLPSGSGRCLADLVVSRGGPTNQLTLTWPAIDIESTHDPDDLLIYIDGQKIWAPTADGRTEIPLPPDHKTCRVQILWTAPTTHSGWIHRALSVPLPSIHAEGSNDLATYVQICRREFLIGSRTNQNAFDATRAIHAVLPAPQESDPPRIRDYLSQWQVAAANGADAVFRDAEESTLRVRYTSTRMLWAGAGVLLLTVILARQHIRRLQRRTQAFVLGCGIVLASFVGVELAWWLSGINAGLAFVMLSELFTIPLMKLYVRWQQQKPRVADSVATAGICLLAVLLTGQKPVNNTDIPPILVAEEDTSDASVVYVRRDLLPSSKTVTSIAPNLCVSNVDTEIELDLNGAATLSVSAQVLRQRSATVAQFLLPIESATLRECAVNGVLAVPVRETSGQPAIIVPPRSVSDRTPNGNTTERWEDSVIEYTLLTELIADGEQQRLTVPLPPAARCRLTISAPDKDIEAIQLAGSGRMARRGGNGTWTFPGVHGHGSVELLISRSKSTLTPANPTAVSAITCLAQLDERTTRFTCRYQNTSLSTTPLPGEVSLPIVPGCQLNACRSQNGDSLLYDVSNNRLKVRSSGQPLDYFEVIWTKTSEGLYPSRSVPQQTLQPPTGFDTEQTLLAVRVAYPFEIDLQEELSETMTPASLNQEEAADLGLIASDRIFEVQAPQISPVIPLRLRSTEQEVELNQTVVVGVDRLDITCRADIRAIGLRQFRQMLTIPGSLQIERVEVLAAGTNRLRSWTVSGRQLVVTLEEGTGGSFQLRLFGSIPVNDLNEVTWTPIFVEGDVTRSEIQLSASSAATAVLLNAGGTDSGQSAPIIGLPLTSTPISRVVVDPSRPIVVHTRPLQDVRGNVAILQNELSGADTCDIAMMVHAGDRGWNGQVRLPKDVNCQKIEWLHNSTTQQLPDDAGLYSPGPLRSTETGVLMLTGLQLRAAPASLRLSLPVLSPAIPLENVRVFSLPATDAPTKRDRARLLQVLNDPLLLTPPEFQDRTSGVTFDEAASEVRIPRRDSVAETARPVVRQVRRSVSVTELHVSGMFLFGTTDILLDFGEALETEIQLPPGLRIVRCQLDGRDLSWNSTNELLSVNRLRDVQRLTIDWLLPSRSAGYVPQQHRLLIPTTDAEEEDHYVVLHPPATEAWVPDSTMTEMLSSHLETEIATAFPELGTTNTDDEEADSGSDSRTFSGQQVVRQFVEAWTGPTPGPVWMFRLSNPSLAGVHYRRRIFWPQWIPMLAMAAAGTLAAGRWLTHERLMFFRPDHDSTVETPLITEAAADASSEDPHLPDDSDHSGQ